MEPDAPNAGQFQVEQPTAIPDHELLRCIGRGSYGTVWLARNSMAVYRAVKIVYRKSFSDHRPFEREWSGIRRFEPISRSHEGFVDVLHVGINEQEGYFYYVMELGDDRESGQDINPASYAPKTLSGEIALHGRLGASECLKVGLALSQALAELHRAGLVHRDIKPSNIIFVNGVPKLADIGLVADVNEARSFVGTEGFIPPEGPGTAQADVYGLGKVLYEASTGKDRHEFPELPTLLDQLPEQDRFLELNEVILHACRPQASSRYASADEMHADLVVLANGKSVKRLRLLEQRLSHLKRIAGISLLGLAVLSATAYAIYRQQRDASEAHQRAAGASVAYGIQAMNSGDFLGALPHFTEALRLEPGDPPQNSAQRLRLGSILDQCPKLTHLWFGRSPANDGQFSPDGTQIMVARFCGDAEVYDLQSGRLRTPTLKPPPTLLNAAYSPDGQLLVTVSQSSAACIWETANFKEVRRLPHPSQLWGARFSPDGLRLVTSASDGVARVWDVRTGLLALALKQHTDAVHFSDFSHDGKFIVTTSHDGTAQLWDAVSGQPARAPLKHGAWVTYAAFSPDDRKFVTASLDRKARVWETATGRRLLPDLEHRDGVQSAEFSPDGRLILTASGDGSARLWLTEDLQPLTAKPVLRNGARVTRACFSPDGHRILTTCADGSARVWDLAGSAGMPLAAPQAFSADGTRFLTLSTNSVQVRDTASGLAVCPALIPTPVLQRATLGCNGRFLLTFSTPGSTATNHLVQVWDVAAGQPIGPPLHFSYEPAGVSLAEEGQRMVAFDHDHVQTWDVLTGSPLSPLLSHKEAVGQSIFSRDGNRVATVSGREVRVWDAFSGRAVFAPLTFPQPVRDAQFSPNDMYLAIGCSDNLLTACYALVYNARTGHPTGPRLNHGAGVLSVAFSGDGRRVVTASADFTAIVWDSATSRQLAAPLKHENQVRSAAFSPDGRWIVTASADRTARVWDAHSGEPLTPPLRGLTPLARAGFLADQSRIVTIDDQGSTQVWKLRVERRPLSTLQSLIRLLSSGAAPAAAGTSAPPTESLEKLWPRLRTQYAADFAISPAELTAWHEFEAQDSELQGQWFAAAFHLEHLLSLQADDPSLTQRLARAKANLRNRN
jgi:WD40 repeat protein/serine/threonine protein kinase